MRIEQPDLPKIFPLVIIPFVVSILLILPAKIPNKEIVIIFVIIGSFIELLSKDIEKKAVDTVPFLLLGVCFGPAFYLTLIGQQYSWIAAIVPIMAYMFILWRVSLDVIFKEEKNWPENPLHYVLLALFLLTLLFNFSNLGMITLYLITGLAYHLKSKAPE